MTKLRIKIELTCLNGGYIASSGLSTPCGMGDSPEEALRSLKKGCRWSLDEAEWSIQWRDAKDVLAWFGEKPPTLKQWIRYLWHLR